MRGDRGEDFVEKLELGRRVRKTGFYRCPECKATKTIEPPRGERLRPDDLPDRLPCGWRGCEGFAVPASKMTITNSGGPLFGPVGMVGPGPWGGPQGGGLEPPMAVTIGAEEIAYLRARGLLRG